MENVWNGEKSTKRNHSDLRNSCFADKRQYADLILQSGQKGKPEYEFN